MEDECRTAPGREEVIVNDYGGSNREIDGARYSVMNMNDDVVYEVNRFKVLWISDIKEWWF